MRRYQKLDELAQKIHLMALSVAFLGTVMLAFTLASFAFFGLLERFGFSVLIRVGAFEISLVTLGVLVGLYLIGWIWARRQYR